MVVVPRKFVFVANPRTGSRSMVQALLRMKGAVRSERHHSNYDEVPTDLPVYAIIRDPHTQLRSWWYQSSDRTLHRATFCSWIRHQSQGFAPLYFHANEAQTKLNIYHGLVTKYFLFERGLTAALEYMGSPPPPVHIGQTNAHTYMLTEEDYATVEELFAEDIKLHKEISRVGLD